MRFPQDNACSRTQRKRLANDSSYFTGWKKIWKEGVIRRQAKEPRAQDWETETQSSNPALLLHSDVSLDKSLDPHAVGRVTHLKCRCDNACEITVFEGCCEQTSLIDSQNATVSEDLGKRHYKGMHQVLFNVTSLQHLADSIIKLSKCLSLN